MTNELNLPPVSAYAPEGGIYLVLTAAISLAALVLILMWILLPVLMHAMLRRIHAELRAVRREVEIANRREEKRDRALPRGKPAGPEPDQ